ncbi:GNAT superfamily N-acetyltransferase [Bradyrhizobium sp. JR3.5]
MRSYPRRVNFESGDVEFRLMGPADEAAVLEFANALAVHDMLFLPRNIREPKVLSAWIKEIERGSIVSLLVVKDDIVVGCGTIVRDPMSWSAHVGEIRTVISSHVRGTGIGRALSNEAFDLALSMGLERLTVQMTSDQTRAIANFRSTRLPRRGRGPVARPGERPSGQDARHRGAWRQRGGCAEARTGRLVRSDRLARGTGRGTASPSSRRSHR